MFVLDFLTKLVFGKYASDGFYKESDNDELATYSLSSIFPTPTVEKKVMKCKNQNS